MTASPRNSPFLVLGLPFGSERTEVARAFARSVRRLRALNEPPFELEDLNWAQHEIEHRSSDPEASLDDFRVPADPSAYNLDDEMTTVQPAPRSLTRRTPPTPSEDLEGFRCEVMVEALRTMWATRQAITLPPSFTIHQE